MHDLNLPDELAAFEAELQSLPRPHLPSALRKRVTADMQATLVNHSAETRLVVARGDHERGLARWWFAACAATAAMLWFNLSMVTVRNVAEGWQKAAPPVVNHLAHTQAALVLLAPELSPADAQRYALTLYSGGQAALLPVPDLDRIRTH